MEEAIDTAAVEAGGYTQRYTSPLVRSESFNHNPNLNRELYPNPYTGLISFVSIR